MCCQNNSQKVKKNKKKLKIVLTIVEGYLIHQLTDAVNAKVDWCG